MKKEKIEILMTDGTEAIENEEVEAFRVTDNLYIHRTYNKRNYNRWTITAMPSGYKIWDCRTKKQAEQVAIALGERFNFDGSKDDLLADKDLRKNGIKFIRKFEESLWAM